MFKWFRTIILVGFPWCSTFSIFHFFRKLLFKLRNSKILYTTAKLACHHELTDLPETNNRNIMPPTFSFGRSICKAPVGFSTCEISLLGPYRGGHWGILETAKPKEKIIQNRKTAKKSKTSKPLKKFHQSICECHGLCLKPSYLFVSA